jgi:hypothetical protein
MHAVYHVQCSATSCTAGSSMCNAATCVAADACAPSSSLFAALLQHKLKCLPAVGTYTAITCLPTSAAAAAAAA